MSEFMDNDKSEVLLPTTTLIYNRKSVDRHYKDILFMFLFGVNILVIASIAFSYGIMALDNDGPETVIVKSNGFQSSDTTHHYDALKLIGGTILILTSAGLMSTCWILFLSKFASYIISSVFICIILASLLCSIGLIAAGFLTVGISLLVGGIMIMIGSVFMRPRIDFAAANLRVACESVSHMPSTIMYALFILVAQITFVLLWVVAASGYATNNYSVTQTFNGALYRLDECTTYRYSTSFDAADQTFTCTSGGSCQTCICNDTWVSSRACFTSKIYIPTFVGLLVSLFWTSAVCSNIVHCTTASSVAAWWVTPDDVTSADSGAALTKESFLRSCTTSLGSICFGSLLVAIVRTLRTFLYLVLKRMRSISGTRDGSTTTKVQLYLLTVFEFVLRLLDRAVVYFNRYAFCFVAIYGVDFITASRSAVELFRSRGWSTLLNDDLIDLILNLGNVIIAVLTMCVGYSYARLMGLDRVYTTLLSALGLFGGYLLSMVVMSTISSAVATVYVCFAEHPEELQASHPEQYTLLTDIWSRVFPSMHSGKGTFKTYASGGGGGGGGGVVDVSRVERSESLDGLGAGGDLDSMLVRSDFSHSSDASIGGSNQSIRGSFKPPLPSDAAHGKQRPSILSGFGRDSSHGEGVWSSSGYARVATAPHSDELDEHNSEGGDYRRHPESDAFRVPRDLLQAASAMFSISDAQRPNTNSSSTLSRSDIE